MKGSAATASQPSARPLAGARQLIEAATGSFGLSIANMLATILATVLLARILGVTDYGTYAFVVATVTLLAVPAVLGADRLVIRDVAVYSHTDSFGLARGLIYSRDGKLVASVAQEGLIRVLPEDAEAH